MADKPATAEPAAEAAPAPPRVKPAEPDREPLPPHVVVLHNDPHNGVHFVVSVLRKVLGLSLVRAARMTAVAHRRGRCVVWSGHKELAELKASQIQAAGPDPVAMASGRKCGPLKATVEPAP